MAEGVIWRLIYYTLRVSHLVVNNLMCIPAYTVWFLLLTPLRWFQPQLYWHIERYLFKALLSFVVMWANTGGYKILESGDDVRSLHDKRVLVLVNHQSTADIPSVMSTLLPKDMVIGQVMWIMDHIFIYTNFGWSSFLHGDFFIQQGKDARLEQLGKLKDHLHNRYLKDDKRWLVLFPEGGFLYKRRERSKKFAEKNGLPVTKHVTLPRLGAMSTILDTLATATATNGVSDAKTTPADTNNDTRMEWVIDLTLAYPGGEALDMHGICIGWWPASHTVMHYRAYPVSDIPLDLEGRTQWLYDRYVEKEKMLEHYYTDNTYLDETDTQQRQLPRRKRYEAPFSKTFYALSYVFYAVSTYIFWFSIYRPFWMCLCYLVSFVW